MGRGPVLSLTQRRPSLQATVRVEDRECAGLSGSQSTHSVTGEAVGSLHCPRAEELHQSGPREGLGLEPGSGLRHVHLPGLEPRDEVAVPVAGEHLVPADGDGREENGAGIGELDLQTRLLGFVFEDRPPGLIREENQQEGSKTGLHQDLHGHYLIGVASSIEWLNQWSRVPPRELLKYPIYYQ